MRRTITKALLLASTAAASSPFMPVLAQVDADEDTIVVTGSRIARPELEASQPVQVVDEADITFSGDVNLVDVVNDLPALIGSNNLAQNSFGAESSGEQGTLGTGTLNLRNLGTARTLTLVDGRRHVSGLAGSAAVDVNTIPAALVERVEVLTGGASAVYGADAVTGVVNFILKDDFEGFDGRAQFSTSEEGDGFAGYIGGTYGKNYADGRGNATLSLTYEQRDNVQDGDRDFARGDRTATDWPNPDRFVQAADIQQFGLDPLLLGEGIGGLCDDSVLAGGASALCDRAANAPARRVGEFPRFNLTSYGSLIGVDFFGDGFLSYFPGDPETDIFGSDLTGINLGADGVVFDLDGNGVEDCLQTVNGTQLQRFDGFAGCHITRVPGAAAGVFQDGLLAGTQNAFGGDGTSSGRDQQDIIPDDKRFVAQITNRFDLNANHTVFFEGKYAYSKTTSDQTEGVLGFYDSLGVGLDNPFLPSNLVGAVQTFVGDNPTFFNEEDVIVFIGRDMTDLGPRLTESERQTIRLVGGFEGGFADTPYSYEVYATYGRTDADTLARGAILQDRFYAASDVTTDPVTGDPVCRSELDPSAEPFGSFLPSGGPFRGFLTYEPGQGLCQPLNLFGIGAPDQAAIDFVTTDINRERTIEQFVASGFLTGDSSQLFELPAGAIDFVLGGEYRKEESEFLADTLEQPEEDPIGAVPLTSRIFPVDGPLASVIGDFDVWEIFGEVSIPLLSGHALAETLRFDAAYRYSEYDTLGGTDTWNLGLVYAPNNSLRFRFTQSQTVRAPNVSELFSPLQADTARPIDPCDAGVIDNEPNRRANCRADGIPEGYTDPLTARVGGFTGGNPELSVETADTFTAGIIIEPSMVPNFSITFDYYDIEIEDGIDSVGLQQLLNACYDAATFPNEFCTTFERDRNPGSATALGLSTFTSTDLNFTSIGTSGYDATVNYGFDLGDVADSLAPYGALNFRVLGNWVRTLERLEDPVDDSITNDLLLEEGQPQLTVNVDTRWTLGDLSVNLQSRYLGEFLEITPRLEIENAFDFENAFTGEMWRHDLSAVYQLRDSVTIYGGINNLTAEEPVISSLTYPFGAIGRQFFVGTNVSF